MMEWQQEILARLADDGNLRVLRTLTTRGAYVYEATETGLGTGSGTGEYYNLSSNDYLGLADPALQSEFLLGLEFDGFLMGNPSSRLMTGNSREYRLLEEKLCAMFGAEAALVLGSGFAVNSGVLPAVTRKGDLILADRLAHASLIDGLQLCGANGVEWRRFRHNDMEHLAELLSRVSRDRYERVMVVTESLFSMDGDFAPLGRLAELQQKYGFGLYLDEAHAFGVYGSPLAQGAGLLMQYNAEHPEWPLRADYLVVTFGKAVASQGAAVVCSGAAKELLVNRMRPLIFSTALPDVSLMWTRFVLERMPEYGERRERLRGLIAVCNAILEPVTLFGSQIIPIRAGDNQRALAMAAALREEGFWTTAIRHPTVPRGEERLRVSLSAAHTEYKIEQFARICRLFG